MKMSKKKRKFGTSVKEPPKSKVVLDSMVYDKCLDEFLNIGDKVWKLNQDVFKNKAGRHPRKSSIMRALKKRLKKSPKYANIVVFSQKGEIHLEKRDEPSIKRRM